MNRDFEFEIKNIGNARKGRFTHKPLTIFCGQNNTGKTWVMYALYHFYDKLISSDNKKLSMAGFNHRISDHLADLFNSTKAHFKKSRFSLTGKSSDWQAIQKHYPQTRLLIPAERSGLHLFFRELSTRRTALLHHASKEKIDLYELLKDVIHSRYALPIAAYINWLNQLPEIQRKSEKTRFHEHAKQIQKKIVGGVYRVYEEGRITFKPYQKKRDGVTTREMDLHLTSSVVKSLFGLWFYLENQACPGDLLMIDEPELNIHPSNQRAIARFLSRLVNAGINVIISTHSDYIVREFNSLIMLSQDTDKTLQKKYKYENDEVLSADKVGAYLFAQHEIKPLKIIPDDGIYAITFDEVIKDLNQTNDGIYYGLKDGQ